MNEKLVTQTAKSLNREKYVLDKLNKQIESLKEKEAYLKRELQESSESLENVKRRDQESKEKNLRYRMMAEEEIMKNKKDHNELSMLREMKKNVQKELNRAVQDNLNAKYHLDSLRETKRVLDNNLQGLTDNNRQLSGERERLNQELMHFKQEYDELMQLYELKKNEDTQLKTLYKFHFK